nr:oligosaccharide flippase family protein [Pseudobutyrivibrio ruminis]
MNESRIKNTKRNIIVSYLYSAVIMLFQFISRTMIVKCLGEQYLGLSSLFASILQILNMAELGFSGAIVYNMYKPIADNDVRKVNSLLAFYRKVYTRIGVVILVVGLVIMPFIPTIINGSYPHSINIYFLFFLYLLNTSISYWMFAYKASLIEGLQRIDLEKLAYLVVVIIEYSLQIISIIIFKSFYAYVVAAIIGTACRNIAVEIISKKLFPQYKCEGDIDNSTKKSIVERVKGLLICNISSITYTTLDSIILSMFVGLESVAKYNNYLVVVNGVLNIILMLRSSMQASVGNSIAKESVEKNYNDMLLWQFLFAMLSTICVTCMFSLYQPFMEIWMGKTLLLPLIDVIFICLWFVISVSGNAYFLYLSGTGSWWDLRWIYISSTVTNLSLNIILGKIFGIEGIIFATLFSTFVFGLIWQCIVIFKKYFNKSPVYFYVKQIQYYAVMVIISSTTYLVTSKISGNGWKYLFIKGIISILCSVIGICLIYKKSKIFKRSVNFIKLVFNVK